MAESIRQCRLTADRAARYIEAMTQSPISPEAPGPHATPASLATAGDLRPTVPESHGHGLMYALLGLFLLALAFGGWGLWKALAPVPGDAVAPSHARQAQLDELQQRIATLTRSDQISRDANRDLQGTLAERDEEIAGLRADVAFYERFVGATGQRRGLTVHELQLQPQGDQAWHFTATLTQNINRGAVNRGRLTLAVEGMRDGKLQALAWTELRQQPGAPEVEYSFKYFQQVEGDVVLPTGMTPLRIKVRLVPAGGNAVEQSFAWADATLRGSAGARAPDG